VIALRDVPGAFVITDDGRGMLDHVGAMGSRRWGGSDRPLATTMGRIHRDGGPDLEVVHIRFPNPDGKPLAGCEAGMIIYVFTLGEVTVCPYLVFAARTPQSQHDPGEFIVGNIFTDPDIGDIRRRPHRRAGRRGLSGHLGRTPPAPPRTVMTPPGLFVSIDGPGGVGKSTVVAMAAARLTACGCSCTSPPSHPSPRYGI
jgi:hypothetical protein